jgi:hypothetical protein
MSRLGRFRVCLAPAIAALILGSAELALACPGCKEALAAQKGGGNLVAGYQWSILFMMAMPFTLLGLFSAYMYWEVRKAQAALDRAAAAKAQAPSAEPEREPATSAHS